jgi:hypothetical protein
MWSTLRPANTFLCTPAYGGRAGPLGARAAVCVRLYRPPRPHPPGQGRGPGAHHHGARPAWHRSARLPCHACVAPRGPRGAAAPLLTTASPVAPLRGGGWRIPPAPGAPESADVRPAHEPVDARPGRRGQVRPGPHPAPGQHRSHAGGPLPVGRDLAAGHPVAHPSRSRVGPEQQRGAPRRPRALTQPPWAMSVGAAVWWSRRAQPAQRGWTDAEATPKLPERPPCRGSPIPKPWPVRGGGGRGHRPPPSCGAGWSRAARCVRSPASCWRGAPPDWRPKAARPGW